MLGGPGAAGLAVKETQSLCSPGGGWVWTAGRNSPSAGELPGALVFQGNRKPAGRT